MTLIEKLPSAIKKSEIESTKIQQLTLNLNTLFMIL